MAADRTGRIVFGSLTSVLVAGLALVAGPLAGAQEQVITGALLVAHASGWASIAVLSRRYTRQPQRWAARPAVFMGMAGGGLLAFAPSDAVVGTLGWVWPPLWLALLAATTAGAHHTLRSPTRWRLVYPLLAAYALTALGASYETIRESRDRRVPPPGQLVDVGGRRLHLRCAGSGTPTVVLESGLGETGAYWGPISEAISRETRVCAYDRAGRGWSEPAAGPQDGVAVAEDLHALLARGGVSSPVVLVGHSSGAAYARIFTGRYPEQVAGLVLLDGQPAEAFERLPDFPAFYRGFRRISALLPSLARVGAGRLVFDGDVGSPTAAGSLRDEFERLPAILRQAGASPTFGNRPLVVVTASRDAQAGWLPLQDEMAALSTNSIHRVVPYTHASLVMDPVASETSVDAISDVVRAVRRGASR